MKIAICWNCSCKIPRRERKRRQNWPSFTVGACRACARMHIRMKEENNAREEVMWRDRVET